MTLLPILCLLLLAFSERCQCYRSVPVKSLISAGGAFQSNSLGQKGEAKNIDGSASSQASCKAILKQARFGCIHKDADGSIKVGEKGTERGE